MAKKINNQVKLIEEMEKALGIPKASKHTGTASTYGDPSRPVEIGRGTRPKASDPGDADAEMRMGCMYDNGDGVKFCPDVCSAPGRYSVLP